MASTQSLLAAARAHHRARRLGEAERLYRQILRSDSQHAESLHLLGMIAFETGHIDTALELLLRAIHIDPRQGGFRADLGLILQATGRLEEALASYDRAIDCDPQNAAAYINRGVALQALRRFNEAEASLTRAVTLSPNSAEAHSNLGNLFYAQSMLDIAEASHRRAVALEPEQAELWSNLGCVLNQQGKLDEAIECYCRVLRLKPAFAETWNNLGDSLQSKGRFTEAAQSFAHALELKPGYAAPRLNLALLRLLDGDLAAGFREYECRWQVFPARGFVQPLWQGEPLDGARILLYAEQGLGDSIQFLRYLPMVIAAGGTVVLELPSALARLALHMDNGSDIEFATSGDSLPDFACHCPLMSLPLAFGTTLESIPAPVPYFNIAEHSRRRAAALRWPESGLRVGLVWAGSPTHRKDRLRSIPLRALEPLLAMGGVHFFSLQFGSASAELANLNAPPHIADNLQITDLRPHIADLADTAALIAHLNLVIGVDTSVMHLAGALGKPVWVMLPVAPDWRWLLDRNDSPWYPTMRLFRQSAPGDWQPVIAAVRDALARELLSLKQEPPRAGEPATCVSPNALHDGRRDTESP